MPNITYKSCYYLFILQPEKFLQSNAICLFSSSCFASQASKLLSKFLFSAQLVHTLSQVDVLFLVFWFSEFSFSSWISWFQNLGIFPPFFSNSCDEIMWWFGVTIATVIFTCRYFKLSWNTSALSQSNCRNFSGSSIKLLTDRYRLKRCTCALKEIFN